MTTRKGRFSRGCVACLFAAALFVPAAAAEAATPAGSPGPESDRLCGFLHNLGVLKADLRDRNKLEQIPVGLNPIVFSIAYIETPEEPAPREPQTPPRIIGILIGDGPALILEVLGAEPIQTIEVTDVMVGMPAAEAGVEPGDLIISIDGEPPGDDSAFIERVRAIAEGESVRLVILREQRILVFDIVPTDTPEEFRLWRQGSESRADAFEDVLAAFSVLYADPLFDGNDFKAETMALAMDALAQVRTAAAMLHLLDALPPERAKASREEILREATSRLVAARNSLVEMALDPTLAPGEAAAIWRVAGAITQFQLVVGVDPREVDRRRHWRTRQLIDSFIYGMRDADEFAIGVAAGLRDPEELGRARFGTEQHRRDYFEALHEEWLGMQWQEAELWRRLVEGDPDEPDQAVPDNE